MVARAGRESWDETRSSSARDSDRYLKGTAMATSEVVEVVQERVAIPLPAESLSEERIAYLEKLVSQARTAAAVFTQYTQEDVDRIVKAMVLAGLAQAQPLARMAVEETKLGVMEDTGGRGSHRQSDGPGRPC